MSDAAALRWQPHPRVRAASTLRTAPGVSVAPFDRCNLGENSGDDSDAVAANRAGLVAALGLPAAPRWLRQVHGTGVVRFAAADAGQPTADAAVTDTPGVVLAILTADCLPVLFAARDGSEVAAAHAGWRGLVGGVIETTVAAMHHAPADLVAWLGPAAGPDVYEIGDEVRDAFLADDPAAAGAFVATRPGHWRIDLFALARRRLARAGVAAVEGGGVCTISDPRRFYSFRRDGRTGRQASLVWITP
jgi:YfiH family protein